MRIDRVRVAYRGDLQLAGDGQRGEKLHEATHHLGAEEGRVLHAVGSDHLAHAVDTALDLPPVFGGRGGELRQRRL